MYLPHLVENLIFQALCQIGLMSSISEVRQLNIA
ncbi:hypothetical protein LH373_09995 [Staphylococcus argenteus]|nr:hypothetical protein [Staphylococcus argenteus]